MKRLLLLMLMVIMIIPISCQSKKEKTFQEIADLRKFYSDILVPDLYQGIHPLDTTQSEEFKKAYSCIAYLKIESFVVNSEKVYLSLCNIVAENIDDDDIIGDVYLMLNEILTMQLGVIDEYVDPLFKIDLLKYTDEELQHLHKLGDICHTDCESPRHSNGGITDVVWIQYA